MSRALALAAAVLASSAFAQQRAIPLSELKSGSAFLGADLRSLQNDDFANPACCGGARREAVERARGKTKQSCASCHQDAKRACAVLRRATRRSMRGQAHEPRSRINACRVERQGAEPFKYESEELLAITAYVARQSKASRSRRASMGWPRLTSKRAKRRTPAPRADEPVVRALPRGELGQAAALGDRQPGPAERLFCIQNGVADLGSLERRLRACLSGIRAEMLPYGSAEYLDLELYLAWRAQGCC